MNTDKKVTAAQMIRQILKANFPSIKFSVTSDHNSVNIRYTDGVTTKEVEALVKDFQYGHFNGMEDIYEYINVNKDIPQVRFLFVNRDMSDNVEADIAKRFSVTDMEAWHDNHQAYGRTVVYRQFQQTSF
jgi:hypothetical protein